MPRSPPRLSTTARWRTRRRIMRSTASWAVVPSSTVVTPSDISSRTVMTPPLLALGERSHQLFWAMRRQVATAVPKRGPSRTTDSRAVMRSDWGAGRGIAGTLGRPRRIDHGALLTDTRPMEAMTLAGDFDREIVLKDGACIRLRLIRPGDEAALTALHERLSQQTAYQRFFMIMPRLPVNWAHHLANVDYRRRLALVAVDPTTADLVAVARYEMTSDPTTAEV